MIRLEDLFVVFNTGTPLERIALRGINFTAQDGEIVTIIGNSGSGRSTLLKFLAGHIGSSFGRLWVNKVDITNQTLSERSKIFSSVFYDEDIGTAGNLTVAENLAIAYLHHRSKSIVDTAVSEEIREMFIEQLRDLDFMGMEELIDEKVSNISKPYRQVLALLIAAIKDAKILLIDEHSTGLDAESTTALLETTEKIIRSRGMTAIMAISDPKFAFDMSDRTIVLNHGQIIWNLSGEEKKNIKYEDLFTSFGVVSLAKDTKQPKLL
ncbi:MAG: ATP-binding cassette domain-containing protein [Holosporaceae bacterium]|jgi:putative ABC transport system ATP-binding protein|nr:ATP-binding cassette domain-containing protein [Holosporaceae bacterium]